MSLSSAGKPNTATEEPYRADCAPKTNTGGTAQRPTLGERLRLVLTWKDIQTLEKMFIADGLEKEARHTALSPSPSNL